MDEHAAEITRVIARNLEVSNPGLRQDKARVSSIFDEGRFEVRTPDGQLYEVRVSRIAER